MSLKVLTVVGTRPNFIKEFLVHRELSSRGIPEVIVHSGQHYDYEMSRLFFDELQLPDPHYHFETSAGSNVSATAEMMMKLEQVLLKERPRLTLAYGDVNSTAAGSITSAKLGIPFVHVEGGIRTPFLLNPEEINRRVSDSVSDLIFTCTRTDTENLRRENVAEDRICFAGDLMKDALDYIVEQQSIAVQRGDYLTVTIHREENSDNPQRLAAIVDALIGCRRPVYFPVHPRTQKRLLEFDLWDKLSRCHTIELSQPRGYIDFIRLLAGCDKVITDSGGVRREGYLLRKPVIVPVDLVWFPEILDAGWKTHVNGDATELIKAIDKFEPPSNEHPEIFGSGGVAEKIVSRIVGVYY